MKLTKILESLDTDVHILRQIISKCSVSWSQYKNENILYRGMYNYKQIGLLSARPRQAKDWSSIPNILFDKQNEGKVQRRMNSIIFSNSHLTSSMYGTMYVIFPVDGATITYGSHSDNNENFRQTLRNIYASSNIDLEGFDTDLSKILEYTVYRVFDSSTRIRSLRDYPETILVLKKAHELVNDDEFYKEMTHMPYKFSDSNRRYVKLLNFFRAVPKEQFESAILGIFDATENNIKTVQLPEIYNIGKDTEMWTESDCYVIEESYIEELEERYNLLNGRKGVHPEMT